MNEPKQWMVRQQSTRNVWELRCGSQLITTSTHYSMIQLVADAHNKELDDERKAHEGASIMASDACKAEQEALRKLRERDEGCLRLQSRINVLQQELADERVKEGK